MTLIFVGTPTFTGGPVKRLTTRAGQIRGEHRARHASLGPPQELPAEHRSSLSWRVPPRSMLPSAATELLTASGTSTRSCRRSIGASRRSMQGSLGGSNRRITSRASPRRCVASFPLLLCKMQRADMFLGGSRRALAPRGSAHFSTRRMRSSTPPCRSPWCGHRAAPTPTLTSTARSRSPRPTPRRRVCSATTRSTPSSNRCCSLRGRSVCHRESSSSSSSSSSNNSKSKSSSSSNDGKRMESG